MLARLFSGPDDDHGLGHPVMAVGDPNQAIYGWRGASVSNILNFADTFPAADGEPGRLPLTVNRRSDRRILEVANRLAAPLLEAYGDKVARLRASAIAGEGLVETHVHERALDELDWLAGAVKEAHGTGKAWSDIGVLSRDNAQAEEVYDTLTSAGIPVEIVGLSGLVRLPGGRRGRRDADPAARRHRQHLDAHPAHRSALGDRPARPAAARPAGRGDRRRPRAQGGRHGRRPAAPDRRRHRRLRAARAQRRRRGARRGVVLARGARPVRAARHRAAPAARPRRRPAARRGAPHHRHDRRRRRARLGHLARGRRAPRQPRPVREGRGRVPVRRRRRDAAGAAGLPHRGGRPGQRPRRRHPDRGRLGQAADGPPRQGPRVVVGLLRRGGGDPLPEQPLAHPLDVLSCRAPRAAAGRPRRPAAARRARQGRARRLPRGDQGPRRRGGAAPGLRRLHPRGPPPRRHVLRLGPARDALRALGLPARGPRPARGVGRARRALDREARPQVAQPQRRRRPVPPLAGAGPGGGGGAAGSRPPSWSARSIAPLPTRASTWSRPPGSPSGTTTSSS